MRINVRLENPLLKKDSQLFARTVRTLIEAAVLNNRAYLRGRAASGRPVPLLYESGVWYEDEPHDLPDELLDIPAILAMRDEGIGADCMHLVAWKVAESRELAEPEYRKLLKQAGWSNIPKGSARSRVRLTWVERPNQKPRRIFHVQERRGDGRITDPSKKLGM